VLSFVSLYDRFYCYRCSTYPAPETIQPAKESAVVTEEPAATILVMEPAAPKEEPRTIQAAEAPREESRELEEGLEISPPVTEKPPLVRAEILEAKKPILMDLCKTYGLDPAGTKEQLRERLLSYLDETEAEGHPETESDSVSQPSLEAEAVREFPETEPALEVHTEPLPEFIRSEPIEAEPRHDAPPIMETGALMEPQVRPSREEPSPRTRESPQTEAVALVIPPVVREVPRVAHPCPTCGRELTYVPQYDRWYCYQCRAYAPAVRSKNACPNCGATLRWIEQYERWWCDSCRRYAPADLPRPQATLAIPVEARVVGQAASQAVPAHRHRNPGSGIGLVGLGLVLFVLYEILVDLPAFLSVNVGFIVASDVAFALRFFAFAFVAIGAIIGLAAVRDRR
jgi:hypothetical protein